MLFPAYKLLSLSVIFLTLSACQVINMVDVKQVNFEQNMAQERQSILTNQKLSQSSKNILLAIRPNLETCVQSPASCMSKLNINNIILDSGWKSMLFTFHIINLYVTY